jgi:Na+-transporting NADH:ubiquinone oxidoreductase subunit C
MRWRGFGPAVSFTLVAPAAALTAPAPALAVDYLTADQAQASLFPEADAFEMRETALAPAQIEALHSALGSAPRTSWVVRVARRQGQFVGAVIVDDVVGKFERITFATAVGADGSVRGVEVLSYRESHGSEIRLASWRKQFVGRTAASPFSVGEDIANISGATLSCRHLTEGVRRAVLVIDALRRGGSWP